MLSLLGTAPASAQSSDSPLRSERLYLHNSGVLLGSTRVISLGGAYVGVAEGVSGFASNLAALAHRSPRLDRSWDVGLSFSYLDLPLGSPRQRDLDNDGFGDNALASRQLLGGVLLQYKRFGVGWYFRSTSLWHCALGGLPECPTGENIAIHYGHNTLAAAVALGRDDFIIGLGLFGAEATFSHHGEDRRYAETGVELDALYRPHGLNYRVGMSVKPQVAGFYRARPNEDATLAGRPLYAAVVSPAVLSLGGSVRLGEGASNYNRLSPAARRDIAERFGEPWLPPQQPLEVPVGPWLLTAQVDLISATEATVALHSFIDLDVATGKVEPTQVGRDTYLSPRVGAEHDTLPGRLRTRLGSYVEPSPYVGVDARPHLTAGMELFVFEYFEKWALSASADIAPRYYNVGLSVGFFR
ncbi:MAG: hypothetical protein HYZ28_23615 [Myxococcales bacterium]|nr:hypothetical protein [Myxococcales bacterium]